MLIPRRIPRITEASRRTTAGWLGLTGLLGIGVLALAWSVLPAFAAPNVYSDGSDGAFTPTAATTTVDLDLATTGSWNQPGNGHGVYDPEKWAVVFKYSAVNIASGKTVTFLNHRSGAPVVWLVQGDITIAGSIALNAATAVLGSFTIAGPGGFAGGKGYLSANDKGCAGLGPGGGGLSATAYGSAGYAFAGLGTLPGAAYGNVRILPLIGGSGGASYPINGETWSGGGGGGAILLACTGTVTIGGSVNASGTTANGNAGGGSGGGIRIIANQVVGSAGSLRASGGSGGCVGSVGRIRIEANTIALTGTSSPDYTWLEPLESDTAVLWPPDTAPRIRVVTVGTQSVPADPLGQFNPPGDVLLVTTDPQPVVLQANNVPITWSVKLRVTQRNGTSTTLDATLVSGDEASSTWQATLTGIPLNNFVMVQARASGL